MIRLECVRPDGMLREQLSTACFILFMFSITTEKDKELVFFFFFFFFFFYFKEKPHKENIK